MQRIIIQYKLEIVLRPPGRDEAFDGEDPADNRAKEPRGRDEGNCLLGRVHEKMEGNSDDSPPKRPDQKDTGIWPPCRARRRLAPASLDTVLA